MDWKLCQLFGRPREPFSGGIPSQSWAMAQLSFPHLLVYLSFPSMIHRINLFLKKKTLRPSKGLCDGHMQIEVSYSDPLPSLVTLSVGTFFPLFVWFSRSILFNSIEDITELPKSCLFSS